MAFFLDFAVINQNVYTNVDTYNTALLNNGAQNELGSVFAYPVTVNLTTAKGQGAPLLVKYVRYNSTANPAVVAGPAPVYWTDETFTVVSGVESEGAFGVNGVAGWLLPNTTSLTTLTAANLNGNFVFIAVGGYVPAAISVGSTVAGDMLIGASGNFTTARVAAGTAPTNTPLGMALTAVSGGFSDVLVNFQLV